MTSPKALSRISLQPSRPLKAFSNLGTYLQMGRAAFRIVRDPEELDQVKDLSFKMKQSGATKRLVEFYRTAEQTQDSFEQRPTVGRLYLDYLRALPEGTLGHAFAKYLDDRGLDPDDLEVPGGPNDEDFVIKHLYETHDIWHVITGFDTDVAGELGLQAFYAAQAPAPLSRVLLILGLINSLLFDQADMDRRLTAISDGWRRGRTARHLFGVDWASQWERPVEAIREELRLGPAAA